MGKPKLSIIIPAYNVSWYIKECIESIVSQQYKLWEIIIIDDGSKDSTLDICLEYASKDERIRVYHKNNGGVSSARNEGIRRAKGEYVTFVDGDDLLAGEFALTRIAENLNYDIVYSPNILFQYPNQYRKVSKISIGNHKQFGGNIGESFLNEFHENRWGCYFFTIKTSIIHDNGILFDEDIHIGEDADWIFRVMRYCRSLTINDSVGYIYRVNREGSAMSQKKPDNVISFFSVVHKWKHMSNEDEFYRVAYIRLCNNAMNYVKYFGLYNEDQRRTMKEAIIKCGAYMDSDSYEAKRIRKGIDIFGFDSCIIYWKYKYKLKLLGSQMKKHIISTLKI